MDDLLVLFSMLQIKYFRIVTHNLNQICAVIAYGNFVKQSYRKYFDMFKNKYIFLVKFFMSVSLSGCASYEDFTTHNTEDIQYKSLPGRDAKPTQEQREAVMSGQKPDWSISGNDGVSVPVFKW
ncbi:hypothetical protein EIM95_15375 [Salmonella enterica]|nr:hypothetical protein [Salmonella enterica]